RPAAELSHQRERGIEVRAASHFIRLNRASSEKVLDGVAVADAKRSKPGERLVRRPRLIGEARGEPGALLGGPPEQQEGGGSQEEIGNRLALRRRSSDGR